MEKLTVVDDRFDVSEILAVEIDFYKGKDMQVAVRLVCEDGSPHSMATVCLMQKPPKDCIWVKNWSENAGMTDILIKADLIHPEIKDVAQSGFVKIFAYRMTDKLLTVVGEEVAA